MLQKLRERAKERGRGEGGWILGTENSKLDKLKSIVSSKMKQPCSVLYVGYLDSIMPKDFLCTAGRQAVFLLHSCLAAASITRYTGEPKGDLYSAWLPTQLIKPLKQQSHSHLVFMWLSFSRFCVSGFRHLFCSGRFQEVLSTYFAIRL